MTEPYSPAGYLGTIIPYPAMLATGVAKKMWLFSQEMCYYK